MQDNVVQNRARGLFGIIPGGCVLKGLADGDAQGVVRIRHILKDLAAKDGIVARAGDDFRSEGKGARPIVRRRSQWRGV